LLSQHLESPSLVWFDLRDLDDDGGQLGNFPITRCRQSLESGRILRRDVRLLQIVEDLFLRCAPWRAERGRVVPGRRRRERVAGVAKGR
jgi:hypothetical protein